MTQTVPDPVLQRNGWWRDQDGRIRWKQSGWPVNCPRKILVGGVRVRCSLPIEHRGACR